MRTLIVSQCYKRHFAHILAISEPLQSSYKRSLQVNKRITSLSDIYTRNVGLVVRRSCKKGLIFSQVRHITFSSSVETICCWQSSSLRQFISMYCASVKPMTLHGPRFKRLIEYNSLETALHS